MIRKVAVLATLLLLARSGGGGPLDAQDSKGPYEPPDREPSPEETLIVELMNRFRANPSAEAELIAPPGKSGGGVDWKMFRDEMKALKPMPPVVFNLDLLDAARKHSYYMIHNGLTHDEVAGKPGFYGASPGDRIKLSGFKGAGWAENAFAGSGGALDSHQGFLVDAGAGPGGMQPERGHRKNMIASFREVGPGGVPTARGLSVTHDFGSRDVRMAGGVVYIDANGNNFYDVGEGVGQVTITSSDGSAVTTWKSGAYELDLKGQKDVTLTAFLGGEKFSKTFPAGKDNVKFDWAVPKEIPLRAADKLIDAADKAKESPKAFSALVALYIGSRSLYLDAERKAKIQELTKEVGPQLDAAEKAVSEALKDPEAAGLKKAIDDAHKPFKGTEADAWFTDAETIAKLKRGVANFQKTGKPDDKQKTQFITLLEAEGARLRTLHFKAELSGLVSKVKGL
ncbi:MAG TPA: CAP domain-containing protein [Planctomycetota bacterium]|nr:CAP domain-containing protein [Planctomycetota bacterium]